MLRLRDDLLVDELADHLDDRLLLVGLLEESSRRGHRPSLSTLPPVNFTSDVVASAPPSGRALVELAADGSRREWTFAELTDAAERLAGALDACGVRQGDVVLTLIGNRPEWAITMLACFRQGYVVLPCTEQLRAKDLNLRLAVARPRLVVADGRNAEVLEQAGWDGPTIWGPGVMGWPAAAPDAIPAPAELAVSDPCLVTFTSGTAGAPKAVLHGQRYLDGQRLQAEHWLAARPGDLVWCTAASGWS